MNNIWRLAVMFGLGLSPSAAMAAASPDPDFQKFLCHPEKAGWTRVESVSFRGDARYWLEHFASTTTPRRQYVVLLDARNGPESACDKQKVVANVRLPEKYADYDLVFDCHFLSEERYIAGEIIFGYVDRKKGPGLHRPVYAWGATTQPTEGSWIGGSKIRKNDRFLCTVLPKLEKN